MPTLAKKKGRDPQRLLLKPRLKTQERSLAADSSIFSESSNYCRCPCCPKELDQKFNKSGLDSPLTEINISFAAKYLSFYLSQNDGGSKLSRPQGQKLIQGSFLGLKKDDFDKFPTLCQGGCSIILIIILILI